MAKKKIRATAELFLDTKSAKSDAAKFTSDLMRKLNDIETAADKLTVFKDLVDYIGQADKALGALKAKNADAFTHMFDGLDTALREQMEGLFGTSKDSLKHIDILRDKIGTLGTKSSIKEVRGIAKEINELFTSAGADAPFGDLNLEFANKVKPEYIDKISNALDNFATVWQNVTQKVSGGFGFGGSGGEAGKNTDVIKKEISKLEAVLKKYKDLQSQFEEIDKIKTTFEEDEWLDDSLSVDYNVKAIKDLVSAYNKAEKARKNFENSGDTSSVAYYDNLKKMSEIALQIRDVWNNGVQGNDKFKNELINTKIKVGSNETDLMESFGEVVGDAEDFLLDRFPAIIKSINSTINTTIAGIKEKTSQLGDTGITKTINDYDTLNQKLKEYLRLQSMSNNDVKLDDDGGEVSDKIEYLETYFDSLGRTKEDVEKIQGIISSLSFDDITFDEALSQLSELLKIDIPSTSTTSSAFVKITQDANDASAAIQEVMYHLGNLLNGKGKARDTFGDMAENLTTIAEGTRFEQYGFGVLGGGLFGVSDPRTITHDPGAGAFIQSVDLSKYNMYMANTEDRATALIDFLSKLQKFSIKSAVPNYDGFDAQLRNVNIDSLYDQYNGVFEQSELTKDQLQTFIDEMITLLKQAGLLFNEKTNELKFTNLTDAISDSENISTRFMKMLGYEGVNVGGTSFDGLGQGSVLFDFDKVNIVGYFNTAKEAIEDYEKIMNQAGGNSWVGSVEQLQQYASNIDNIINKMNEAKSVGKILMHPEDEETLNKLTQIRQNIDLILSGKDISGNNPFTTITTGSVSAEQAATEAKVALQDFLNLTNSIQGTEYFGDDVEIGKYIANLETAKQELEELGKQGLITAFDLEEVYGAFDSAKTHLRSEIKGYTGYGDYYTTYRDEYYEASNENDRLRNELAQKEDEIENLKKQGVGDGAGSSEEVDLENLLTKVNAVKEAVELKTQSFREESDVVGSVVQQEIQTLETLKEKLQEIKNLVDEFTAALNGQWVDKIDGLFPKLQQLAQNFASINETIRSLGADFNLETSEANAETGERQFTVKMDTSDMESSLTSATDTIQRLADDVVSEMGLLKNSVMDLTDAVVKYNTSGEVSEKDQKVENMKKNILQLFDTVNKHNVQDDLDDEITSQEMAAEFFADGSISLGKGESNTVPWNKIAENLLSNLNSKSVMSMHSHPWNVFYDRDNNDIMRLASDNFSRTDGDLGAFQIIQEYGTSIASMLAGNILHALDLDKISWHYNDFIDNFKNVEKEYAENPNYSKHFFKGDGDDISFRMQDTLSENHEQSNMIKNMLIDALNRTGFSDKEVFGSIYKEYNLTNDDDVTNLATRLVELSSLSQKAESQVEMLRKILASFDIDVGSDDVDVALKSFEKGEMTAADVWNRFNGSKKAVSQAAIDAVQRIDSGRQESVEVQILSKIASVLDSINSIVANIEANTQQTINDKLNIGADTLGNIISNESLSSIVKKTNLGVDFANITEYQAKDLFEAAELSMRTLTSDMEAIFGKSTVTAIDAKTLLDSYMRAATDNIAANRAISLYQGQYNTLPVKSDFTDEVLEKTIRDNQKSLMNDVAQNILDYINRVRENFADGVIKTVDIPEKSVNYDYIIDLLDQKSLEAVVGPDKEKRDRITGILTGIAGMKNNSSDDLIEGGEFVDAMTGQIRTIDEIFEDVNTFEKDYGEDLQVVKKYINQVFSKYNAQMDAFLDGDKDFSFFNETSDSKDNSVKPTILSGDAKLDAIISNIVGTIDTNTQNLNELTNAINTAISKLDGLGELNTDSIATAVKEAIYAKEIQAGYTKINSFEDAFDKLYGGLYLGDGQYTQDEYENKFTGELFGSLDEATNEFEQNFKGAFFSKDGTHSFNNIDNLLAHIIDAQNMEPSYQNDWATVIVQAINTQGDRIAEAIKIVLPNSVSDKIESGDSANEQEIVDAFQHVAREVSTWTQMTREEPRDFFRDLLHSRTTGMTITDPKTIQAFKTLGMMSESGKPTFKLASQGMRNSGVVIGEEYVMPTRPKSLDQVDQLGPLLDEASKLGAAVPRIVSSFTDSSKIFELQTRMIGENIASSSGSWDFLKATDAQIDKLIHTFETLSKVGLYPDFIGDNVLFDKNKGFSLVDLETTNISWGRDLDDAEGMTKWFLDYVENIVPRDLADQFRQRVNERMALPPEMRSTSPHDVSKNDTAIYQLLSKIAGTIDAINSNIQSIASNYNAQQNDANYVKDQYPTQSYEDIKRHNLKYEANNIDNMLEANEVWARDLEADDKKANALQFIRGSVKGTTDPYFTRGRYGEVVNQLTGEMQYFNDILQMIENFEQEYSEDLQFVKDYLNKVFSQYDVQTDAVLNQQSGAYGDVQSGDAYVSDDMSGIDTADVQEEINSIEKLLLVLQQVEEAVQNKTQAFVNEGDVVGQVVNEEVAALQRLSELIELIASNIGLVVDGFNQINTEIVNAEANKDGVEDTVEEPTPTPDATSIDTSYALDNTVLETNRILESILVKLGDGSSFSDLVEPLNTAVTELKNVVHGIVEHQKAQRTDLTDSSARIANNYGQLSSIAGNATAGLGEEYQIENMKALADNVVRVKGAVKDTEGVWKGFVVDIDESNKAVIRSVDEQSAFAKSLNESAQAAKNAGTEVKEAGPKDEFSQSLSAAKSAFNEYRKNLQGVDYLSDEAKDSLDELAIRMGSISNAGELDAWIDDLRTLQKQVAISKSGFEHSNLGTIKGVQNKLDTGYNKLTLEQQKEVEEDYHRITDILEQYKASVRDGKKVELEAIHAATQALREKIEAQLALNQAAEDSKKAAKKNEKFGSTVAVNATAKFNSLKDQATSGEFASSENVANALKETEAAYQKLIETKNRLNNSDDEITKDQEADFKRLRDEYNEKAKALKKLLDDSRKLNGQFTDSRLLGDDFQDTDEGRKAALADFVKEVYGVTVAAEDFRDGWQKVVFTVDNGDGTFTEMTATLNAARTQVGALAGDVKKNVGVFESFFNELKGKFKSISAYLISSLSIHEVWQQVRKGVEYVKEIDGALTELKKVTDETDASYDIFLQDMSKTGSVIGATVANLTTMAADWARLGYSMEEAGKLAESTAILLNVSEFEDATKASEALISTMQAFQYTADESQHVVDILNEVKVTCLLMQ